MAEYCHMDVFRSELLSGIWRWIQIGLCTLKLCLWMFSFVQVMVIQGKINRRHENMVGEYERMARTIADYRNHLQFNLRCRQEGLIPTILWLGSALKGYRADRILNKAQNHLLNEPIRQVHFTIEVLKEKADHFLQRLRSLLPVTVFRKGHWFHQESPAFSTH